MLMERSAERVRRLCGRLGLAALVLVLSWGGARTAEAATYTFVKDYTSVRFSWSNLGMSRQSARVMDITGTIEFDPVAFERS